MPPMLQAVTPQRLYRQIADQLRQNIDEGRWPVGARLPAERELASLLQVSRPSLREALIALEVEGLIEVRSGSGIYVLETPASKSVSKALALPEPQQWGPLEVMHARMVVEAEVAALAARHARKSDVSDMQAGLARMREQAAQGQVPREGDEMFHAAVAHASGNEVLCDMVGRTWQARYGRLFERLGEHFERPLSWRAAIDEHAIILSAIERHDERGARAAMRQHLKKAIQRYSAAWQVAPPVSDH
jgi:DNA-binding FadR family transcriptional regulator